MCHDQPITRRDVSDVSGILKWIIYLHGYLLHETTQTFWRNHRNDAIKLQSAVYFFRKLWLENNLLFFERLQTTVSHTSAEQFSARSKAIITVNSVYIRSIKKRELVNVYREDIQSILRKQRPFPFLRNVTPTRSWVANQGPVRKIWLYFFKSR